MTVEDAQVFVDDQGIKATFEVCHSLACLNILDSVNYQ
jgi:hypothetical protein